MCTGLYKFAGGKSALIGKAKHRTRSLEETFDFASLGVDVDIYVTWSCWETWDGLDICRQGIAAHILVFGLVSMKQGNLQVSSTDSQSDV